MKFTVYDAQSGRVLYGGECPDPGALTLAGQQLLTGQKHAGGWIADGAHHPQPARPGPHHEFNWTSKAWTDPRTLADLKAAKWEAVKRWRAAAVVAPLLPTRFGTFDGDAAGVENLKSTISGLREAIAVGMAPDTITWTLADNSTVDLTPPDLSEVAALLLARGNAAHERARELRAQIDSARAEQLDLITWTP